MFNLFSNMKELYMTVSGQNLEDYKKNKNERNKRVEKVENLICRYAINLLCLTFLALSIIIITSNIESNNIIGIFYYIFLLLLNIMIIVFINNKKDSKKKKLGYGLFVLFIILNSVAPIV